MASDLLRRLSHHHLGDDSAMITPQGMLADWDDPQVQIVYNLLCDGELPPNREEHWEGYVSRRIIAALRTRQAAAPQGREAEVALRDIVSWKDDTLGKRPKEAGPYDCAPEITEAFDRGARMAFYRCADRASKALALTPAVAPDGAGDPDGAGEAIIEKCAIVCDKHAQWAEDKIEDDPASTRSQIFATISNTANDCAEMIRDLTRLPVDYSGEVTKAQVHQVNELVRPEFEKGHWVDVESEAALAQAQEPGEDKR